jgi:hypothetical protein
MLRGLATPSLPGGFETKSPGQFQATLGPTTNHANGGLTPPFPILAFCKLGVKTAFLLTAPVRRRVGKAQQRPTAWG